MTTNKLSRIAVYRDGDIEKSSDSELEEIRGWHIEIAEIQKGVYA